MRLILLFTFTALWTTPSLSYDHQIFTANPYTPYVGYDSTNDLYLAAMNEGLIPNPNYQPIGDQLVMEVHESMTRLFPEFMSNKKPTGIVVTNDGSIYDASARGYKYLDSRKGFIHIPAALLADSIPHSIQVGIIAHEMAHLYLKHRSDLQGPIDIYYSDNIPMSTKEVWAFRDWQLLASYMGENNSAMLQGMLSPASRFQKLLQNLVMSFAMESPDLMCQAILVSEFEAISYAILVTPTTGQIDHTELGQRIQEFDRSLDRCLDPSVVDRFRINLEIYHKGIISLSGVDKILLGQESLNFYQLRMLFAQTHAQMRELKTKFRPQKIRFYSSEDQADELASLVIKEKGLDLETFGSFLLEFGPEQPDECLELIATNKEIPFGPISQAHRPNCYRAQKITKEYPRDVRIKVLR